MIVTAVIMSIAFSNIKTPSEKTDSSGEINHGETVQMASESESSSPDEEEKLKIEADSSIEENTSESLSDYVEEDEKIEDDNKADENKEDVISDTEVTLPEEEEVTEYKVTIISGEVSNRIADRLEGLGLIDDGKAFNKYLEENKIDHSLRPGTYMVKKGLSYEEIADILMKK